MSDDLRERVAAIADKITHAMDQGVEDGYVEEMISMFKQDAVEAVEAMKLNEVFDEAFECKIAHEFNDDLDDVIRTINQL